MPDKPTNKSRVRDAQQQHLNQLFGDADTEVARPSAQQADDQQAARARELSQAAQAKQAALDAAEQQKLADLKNRQAQASARVADHQGQAGTPSAEAPVTSPVSDTPRMQHSTGNPPLASQPTAGPAPAPTPPAPPSARPPVRPPAVPQDEAPLPPRDETAYPEDDLAPPPRPKRAAPPSPEELDRLLRAMARRAAQAKGPGAGQDDQYRPAAGATMPRPPARPAMPPRPMPGGMDRVEQGPAPVEAPPEVPDEAPEKNQEKQAEIVEKLRARESQAQAQAKPVPQIDQERAVEEAVEANLTIETERNAVRSAPLHLALEQLRIAQQAHDPDGQVNGVNDVQANMENHPLYKGNQHG